MAPKTTLWGIALSPPVRAVLLTLKALNVDYEFKEVNTLAGEQMAPEYLKKNPQHTVPLLEDDGNCIWDSHAIIAYLARKYGKNDSLYPKDFYKRAVVDQRLHYENGVLFTTCTRQSLGPIIRGLISKDEIAEKVKQVYEQYDLLETFLGNHSYIAGDGLTIADFSIVSTVSSLALLAPIDSGKHPKLAAWLERLQQLPYYEEGNGKGLKAISELLLAKLAECK